jgi:hypothetical protein
MISDLAIIAFATKNVSASRKNILTDLCGGDAEDDRPPFTCIFN